MFRDRIQKQVYPQRKNTATILNYLEELLLINAKEVGLVPIDQDNQGYQDIPLPYNEVIFLEVPQEAVSATIMVEQGVVAIDDNSDTDSSESFTTSSRSVALKVDSILEQEDLPKPLDDTIILGEDQIVIATDSSAVLRFKENGSLPTLSSGFGLGNQDIFELVGTENLNNFRVIGIQQNSTPVLRIQFYKTAQFQ